MATIANHVLPHIIIFLMIIYNQCQNCIKVFKIHHVTSLEDPESCDKPKSERCKHKSHSSYQKDSFVLEIEIDENIHQPCRRDSKEIFICDSPETKEIPDVEEIPKNLTTFILTKTQVFRIRNNSFNGIQVSSIQIFNNPNLTYLESHSFFGAIGLKEILIQNNKQFGLLDSATSLIDFYYPFSILNDLDVLVLNGNRLNLSNSETRSGNKSGPCLAVLNLSSNEIASIGPNFFRAFSCGNIHFLALGNSKISYIHKDAFSWTPRLSSLDLSDSENLTSLELALQPLKHLIVLDLSSNNLQTFPSQVLLKVNRSLERLNLTQNVFSELKLRDVPYMPKLRTLILDNCRIKSIEQDTLKKFPSLEYLSLKYNPFEEIPILKSSSLKHLSLEKFKVPDNIDIAEFTFAYLRGLEELSLVSLNLGELVPQTFNELQSLTTLKLEKSRISNIQEGTFSVLPKLKVLLMANCENIHTPTVDALKGSKSLEMIDLSFVSILGESKNTKVELSFENAKVLNLTGSLAGTEQPMDYVHFNRMPKLEILSLSKNPISEWNITKFYNNTKLKILELRSNHEYVSLTVAMILDFKELDELDLSGTKFNCNDGVLLFCQLMEQDKHPNVKNWENGTGFTCRDENGERHTFWNYTYSGEYVKPSTPGSHDTFLKNCLFAVGGLTTIAMISIILFYTFHSKWWYFKYLIAKQQSKRRKFSKSESFTYDCFVSYNSNDTKWVYSEIVSQLETNLDDQPLKLCLHERDFQIGQNITENIVACLENSQNCILVLTEDYAKSRWCNFEAEVANHIFSEQKRIDQLV